MRALLLYLLLVITAGAGAQEHVHDAAPPVAAPAAEHQHETVAVPSGSVHQHEPAAGELPSHDRHQAMHGGMTNWLLMADRFEFTQHDDNDVLQWELQGWIGKDEHKLWMKSEGVRDRDAGSTEEAELQLLYSHAIAPYWDVQAGLRHDDGDAGTVSYAAVGVLGLAPYWFETDAAVFLSEAGRWSARLEVEYELRFTQRLILQPRLEMNYAFAHDTAAATLQGFNENSLGLRLRYEFLREVAPYVGVEWWQTRGAARSDLQRAGRDSSEARVVAGLRLWY
jgi:copper resistance protein B